MTKITVPVCMPLLRISAGFSLLAMLAACVSTTPEYDKRFGDAVRQSRLQMTINPNAGSNPDAVLGMDGISAREALVNYQNTFKTPTPVTSVMSIGGSGGGNK